MSNHDEIEKIRSAFENVMRAGGCPESLLVRTGDIYPAHHIELQYSGFCMRGRLNSGASAVEAFGAPPAIAAAPVVVLSVETAPIGSKALCEDGGYWTRNNRGWKWMGPTGNGQTLVAPGAGWTGRLIAPNVEPPSALKPISAAQYAALQARLIGMTQQRDDWKSKYETAERLRVENYETIKRLQAELADARSQAKEGA